MTNTINPLRRCLLAPNDEAAFDTYRRAVARSGGDGQRVCAPVLALVRACPAIAPVPVASAHLRRKSQRSRCAGVASGSPACPSADAALIAAAGLDLEYVYGALRARGWLVGSCDVFHEAIYCDNRTKRWAEVITFTAV